MTRRVRVQRVVLIDSEGVLPVLTSVRAPAVQWDEPSWNAAIFAMPAGDANDTQLVAAGERVYPLHQLG